MSKATEKLVTIATFGSVAEASVARSRLDAADIPATLDGDIAGTTLWHVGTALGGVKLLVAASDVERACEALTLSADDAGETPSTPWTCPTCGESVDAGFAVCWSCGTSFDDGDGSRPIGGISPAATSADLASPARCPMCGADRPSANPGCPHCGEQSTPISEADQRDEEAAVDPAEDYLRWGWRSAVIGIAILPPLLSFYSTQQMAHYHRIQSETQRPKHWKAKAAFWINAASILFWSCFWLGLFTAL